MADRRFRLVTKNGLSIRDFEKVLEVMTKKYEKEARDAGVVRGSPEHIEIMKRRKPKDLWAKND